jgi:hypothetical protein
MNLVDRAKNILLTPKTEWEVIAAENTPTAQLITGYVLPLAGVAAVASFIGMSVIGFGFYRVPIATGIGMLVWHLIASVISVFVLAFIADALAPTFGAQKSMAQALKLAVYSYTPGWIAGIFGIIPLLGLLAIIGALYGIYLLYLGLPRLMKNPDEKTVPYLVVIIVAAIILYVIVAAIGSTIAGAGMLAAASHGSSPSRVTVDPAARRQARAVREEDGRGEQENGSRREERGPEQADGGGDGRARHRAIRRQGRRAAAARADQAVRPGDLRRARAHEHALRALRAAGFMVAKAEGSYGDASGKHVDLEVVDTGGMAGLMGLASWAGVQGERETDDRMERTRREGSRMVHEEVSKRGGTNKYALVLNDRFVGLREGHGRRHQRAQVRGRLARPREARGMK